MYQTSFFLQIEALFCNLLQKNQLFIFPVGPLDQTLVDPLGTQRHTVGWWGSSPPTDGCPDTASFLWLTPLMCREYLPKV